MTAVSATNDTNVEEVDSTPAMTEDTTSQTSELITKKIDDNVKTSSNQNTKSASKISTDSITIKYNNTVNLQAKVTNAETGKTVNKGKVVFKVNGKTVGYANVTNGLATLAYDSKGLTPKNYTITAKYGETSTLKGSSASSTLTVKKDSTEITVNNATVITKSTVKLTAKITNSKGNLVTDGKVVFKINGKTVALVNATKGIATYNYVASSLSAKNYTITATYGGNKLYESSRSPASILTVTPIPTKISISKVSGYSTTVKLKATVVDKIRNTYLSSGVVVFKINDKTVGNSSIVDGKASFTYNASQLARGTYKISAHLKASSIYDSSSASNNLTILAEDYFTYDQVKKAAVDVRTQLEANNSVLTVYIGKSRIGLSDFLALMIQTVKNVYYGKSSAYVQYQRYNTLTSQIDTVKGHTFKLSEMMEIGDRVLNYMKTNNVPPKYASTSYGNMGYYNIVYSYSKMLDVSTKYYLPETCKVYSWATIHPNNPKSRTIYITSDVVYYKSTDYMFMRSVKEALESKGYNVIIAGYGPNAHNTAIWSESLPANAVQLSIFSGADAGVIYDVCTRSFMRKKANRLLFFVYYPTSRDITGLSYLERAHDDYYSSASFKGIANPDIYLRSHGYDYVYSGNVNVIANSLISYIS